MMKNKLYQGESRHKLISTDTTFDTKLHMVEGKNFFYLLSLLSLITIAMMAY